MTAAPQSNRMIRFKIKRQEAPDSAPHWEQFEVPFDANHNVISCLQYIAEHPRTTEGRNTTPVVWDCNCLEEVCGACMMRINGRVRQSCSALIVDLTRKSRLNEPIILEPMSTFPVIRDLVVNRQRMFDALITIKGWVPIDGTHQVGTVPVETSTQHDSSRYAASRCMTCGCCLEAYPQFQRDNRFIGAHAIGRLAYFNGHQSGRVLMEERINVLSAPGGIADCGNAQNSVKVCSKDIPLTEAIAKIGRQATVHATTTFFTGR